MTMAFETGARTDRGLVRSENEDCYFADPAAGLWAVADGMGGHAAGAFASRKVVDALATVGRTASGDDLIARVASRLVWAHDGLRQIAADKGLGIIGTTVVVLMVHGRSFAGLWSGDSRLYRLRDGELERLSRDHSEVEELVARGILGREEAESWIGRNAITRAVGVHDEFEYEVVRGDVARGDVFVLCSDGLTLHVPDEEIGEIAGAVDAERAAAELVDLAVKRGGEDNVTVVVARCTGYRSRGSTVMRPGRGTA